MSEESSGPTSPRDLGLDQVCVVICNGDDPEGCSGHVNPNSAVQPEEGAQKEKDEAEEEQDHHQQQQDCQEQAMLAEEESGVDGKSGSRKDSGKDTPAKQPDRPQNQQHSATFGVTADDEEDELPFPGFVPKTFYYFNQRHWLRFPCLRLITSPYPLSQSQIVHIILVIM